MAGNDRPQGRLPDKVEPLLARLAPPPVDITEDHIQALLIGRRGREALFGTELFSDPAWDILLEVYAGQLGGRTIDPADLAKTTTIPLSVINRWLTALSSRGLVTIDREGGLPLLKLTADGAAKMFGLASRWASAFVSV